ncbi:MAG: acyl-CoA dehydrogenase family protein [Deltaproteobacteria bacterium]|nr:acyl-CoA dehydrogenase family protein [Deltaproteobacteria bacterium]
MIDYAKLESAIGLNWYAVDPNLRLQLERHVPAEDLAWAEEKVAAMGGLIGGPIARNAEAIDKGPAQLVRWDRNGEEVNQVIHPPASLDTKRRLWKAGFLGLPYTEEVQRRGRPVPAPLTVAYHYLLSQADTGMLCGTGMTTGALQMIEEFGNEATKARFAPRLKALDYDEGLDGSMFLTERVGGSDLSTVETTARFDGANWRINGFKWFCSNVDGRVAIVLARPEGGKPGIKGLAVFAVPRFLDGNRMNGLHIRRIKDKLGTRSVPTGEVDFVEAVGYLLAGAEGNALDGRGINRMMSFVTESRISVAAMGAGIARRAFLEAAIYAAQREVFGRRLVDHGMAREMLMRLLVGSEGAAALLFKTGAQVLEGWKPLAGREPLLRLLVPLTKLRCARRGLNAAVDALEMYGGNGFIEDWPLARQLRDAQAHTVWEGTENILALDVLRAITKDRAHEAGLALVEQVLARATDPLLRRSREAVAKAAGEVREALGFIAQSDAELVRTRARRFATYFADLLEGTLLLDEARWELETHGSARKALVADWFAREQLTPERCRGICSRDATLEELFLPVLRYERIAPAEAAGQLTGRA